MLAVATLGTIIGDILSYGLGRWGGRWLEGSRFESHLRVGAVLMQGRAKWFIPLYHFHNVTRTFGPFGAGALKMPLRIWVPLDHAGALISNAAWMGAGVILGRAVMNDDGTLNEHPALRIGAMVASVVFGLVVYSEWLKSQRKQREAEEGEGDRVLVTPDGSEPSDPHTQDRS
jgi:membrane protein DedA with SNARE-associated domain